MNTEILREIYDFLQSKGIQVSWQNYEPCLFIPFTYWEDDTKYRNYACLFSGETEFQVDPFGAEEIDSN